MTAVTTIKELSDGNSAGTRLGQSATDKASAFGAAPVVQPTNANQAAVTVSTVTTAATTTTPWGFATSTQANNLAATVAANTVLLNQIRSDLVTLGWLKGS